MNLHFKYIIVVIYSLLFSLSSIKGYKESKCPQLMDCNISSINNSSVHEYLYNVEKVSDSLRQQKKSQPLIAVWINENNPNVKRVHNTYSYPCSIEKDETQGINMDGMNPRIDMYGLSYNGRPIIWFLDNVFYTITNLKRKYASNWGHNKEIEEILRDKSCKINDKSYKIYFTIENDQPTSMLNNFMYVYITDEQNVWKKYISVPDFEECNPVTVLIYTKDFANKILNGVQSDSEAVNLLKNK